jgi:hypothetical protein
MERSALASAGVIVALALPAAFIIPAGLVGRAALLLAALLLTALLLAFLPIGVLLVLAVLAMFAGWVVLLVHETFLCNPERCSSSTKQTILSVAGFRFSSQRGLETARWRGPIARGTVAECGGLCRTNN